MVLFSACHFNASYSNREADKADAEQIARRFYDFQKAGDFSRMETFYAQQYKRQSSPEKRLDFLNTLLERLGPVKEITLEAWESEVTVGSNASSHYQLVYQVVRSKRMSRETLYLMKEADSIRIEAYNVNSDAMNIPGSTVAGDSMPAAK